MEQMTDRLFVAFGSLVAVVAAAVLTYQLYLGWGLPDAVKLHCEDRPVFSGEYAACLDRFTKGNVAER